MKAWENQIYRKQAIELRVDVDMAIWIFFLYYLYFMFETYFLLYKA